MPRGATAAPKKAANGKPASRKCTACGLTGKHAPTCKHALQPSKVETPGSCAHADVRPIPQEGGGTAWECDDCGEPQDIRANAEREAPAGDAVFDGKTGAPKTSTSSNGASAAQNGASGQQVELVKLTDEQIIHEMMLKQAQINVAASEAGRARKKVKTLKDERETMIAELIGRDAEKWNLQLPLVSDDDEDDDE